MREWIVCQVAGPSRTPEALRLSDAQLHAFGVSVNLDVSVMIQGASSTSTLRPTVTVAARYERGPLGNAGAMDCISSGALEKLLIDNVRQQ
jgi:hypothetical protein